MFSNWPCIIQSPHVFRFPFTLWSCFHWVYVSVQGGEGNTHPGAVFELASLMNCADGGPGSAPKPFPRLYIINPPHLCSLGMSKTNPPPRLVEYSGTMFNSASRPHLLYAVSPRNKISPSLQAKGPSLVPQVLSHYFSPKPSFQKFLLSQLYLHNILEIH